MKAFRILTAALALVAFPGTAAHACSCITASAQTYLARSVAAFTGEARLVQPQGGGVVVVTFRVARVYKGDLEPEVSVFTGAGVDNCGIAFTAKRAYTVFAASKNLVTGLCDGTAEGDTLAGTRAIKEYTSAPPPTVAATQVPVASTAGDSERTLPIAAASVLACAVAVSILRRASAA